MPVGLSAMKRSLDDFYLRPSTSRTTTRRNSLSVLTSQATLIKKKLEAYLRNSQTPEAERKEIKEVVQELQGVLENSKRHVQQQ
jgi:hypothetical protein